ncbi:hypothetical protein KFK09_010241 [Dendrobium nobile]|uniref:Reverse transcriptase domain-containing protein n=1 Tax=Dendrobium nobile TaxID=94219 RepID=A0A8T3BPR7_DENNO|nr:hypothetical protein KFK09_010241 [Dendrobium nobile]
MFSLDICKRMYLGVCFFADDIIFVDKTREGVEGKLELWRSTLKSKGFHSSRSKTEYMECNFSSNRPSEGIVTLGDKDINKSTHFRYLRSIVQRCVAQASI